MRIGGNKATRITKKATIKVNTQTGDASFDLLYKQSKKCAGADNGICDPFMKEEVLYELMWRMGFPNNPSNSDGDYDTSISFDGPAESLQAAKAIVRAEYSKIKAKGAIAKFVLVDA